MNKKEHVSNMIKTIMAFYDKDATVTFNYNGKVKLFTVTTTFKDEDLKMDYAYMTNLSDISEFVKMEDNLNSFIENVKNKNIEQLTSELESKFSDYISTVSIILEVDVSQHFKCRLHEYVLGRQLVMWKLKKTTNLSLREIGEKFEQNHSTVFHAVKTINNLIETDKTFRDDYCLILG